VVQLSSTSHGEAQVVKAAAEGVEAIAGPFGIHRTRSQRQGAVDHDGLPSDVRQGTDSYLRVTAVVTPG
jgi:hypothetical protein